MISSDASTEFVQVLLAGGTLLGQQGRASPRLTPWLLQVDKHLVVSELGIHYR